MTEHTPGPWKIGICAKQKDGDWLCLIAANPADKQLPYRVATISLREPSNCWGSDIPDLKLLVAAPELFDLVLQYRNDLHHPVAPDSRERRIAAIDAAIAKVTGQ